MLEFISSISNQLKKPGRLFQHPANRLDRLEQYPPGGALHRSRPRACNSPEILIFFCVLPPVLLDASAMLVHLQHRKSWKSQDVFFNFPLGGRC